MKAVKFRGVGDIRIEVVPEPKIEQPTDAVVRLTSSATAAPICISCAANAE